MDGVLEDLRGDLHHLRPAEIAPGLGDEEGDRPEHRLVFLPDRGADPHGGFRFGVRRLPEHALTLRPESSYWPRASSYWFQDPPCVTAIPGFYLRRGLHGGLPYSEANDDALPGLSPGFGAGLGLVPGRLPGSFLEGPGAELDRADVDERLEVGAGLALVALVQQEAVGVLGRSRPGRRRCPRGSPRSSGRSGG